MTSNGVFHRLVFFSIFALCCLLAAPAPVAAYPSKAAEQHPASSDDWQFFLRQGEPDKAEPLCKTLLDKKDKASRVDGYKCMANVILFKNKTSQAPAEGHGDGMHQGWNKAGADQAIEQLEQAMKLAPDDLSLHQMRLFVLSRSGQMNKLPQALENSLQIYTGPDALDHWLSFAREFWNAKELGLGLEYLDVLAAKYPDNAKILGNLAAFAGQEGKLDLALEYALKSVELQPENPRNQWNLASLYEHRGEHEKADAQFQKALPLFKDPAMADSAWCTYGLFVENTLKDSERAKKIIEKHCKKSEAPQE